MDELAKAESVLEEVDHGYLVRVREAAARLGVRGAGPDPVRDSLQDAGDLVHIDADVPTYASQRGGKTIKTLVKRSIGWYIRYLATQTNALGQAMITFGNAVADRLDELDSSNQRLGQRIDDIARRLDSLETGKEKKTS